MFAQRCNQDFAGFAKILGFANLPNPQVLPRFWKRVKPFIGLRQFPPKIIVRENGISQDTLTGLTYHWREIMELENENRESMDFNTFNKTVIKASKNAIYHLR